MIAKESFRGEKLLYFFISCHDRELYSVSIFQVISIKQRNFFCSLYFWYGFGISWTYGRSTRSSFVDWDLCSWFFYNFVVKLCNLLRKAVIVITLVFCNAPEKNAHVFLVKKTIFIAMFHINLYLFVSFFFSSTHFFFLFIAFL